MQRWYAAQASNAAAISFSASELANQSFGSFCPLEITEKSAKPLFGSYFFVQFDVERDRWRSVLGTRGVKSLLGLTGDRPNPLAFGIVEELQERAERGEFDRRRLKVGWEPIDPGMPIRCGHFDGIVQLDMGSRIKILYRAFGAQREAIVKRELVEVAA